MLLATLSDNVVVSKQTGKVRDKDRTWDSVKKSLLGNINGFLEELKVCSGICERLMVYRYVEHDCSRALAYVGRAGWNCRIFIQMDNRTS